MTRSMSLVLRGLRAKPFRLVGLCLSVALGVGFFGGVRLSFRSVPLTLATFYASTDFHDMEIGFLPEDSQNLPDVERVPGVAHVERRLVLPASIALRGGGALTGILVLGDHARASVDRLRLVAGSFPREGSGGVVIERSLAEYHGFAVGDVIEARVGEKVLKARVEGIAISPEFFAMSSNPNFVWPEKGTLGVVFGGHELFSDALGFTLVNDLVLTGAPGARATEVEKAVLAELGSLAVDKAATRDRQFSHEQIMFNLRGFENYAWVMVLVLLLLALFVSSITLTRMVVEQRRAIGTLCAIGYSARRIAADHLLAAAMVGLGSGLVGCGLAVVTLDLFLASFSSFMGLPFTLRDIDPSTFAMCIAIAILIVVVTMAVPLALLLRNTPSEMIRAGYSEPRPPGEAVGATFVRALPVPVHYGARNLLRRPWLTSFAISIIAFSVAVSISYAVCTSSYNRTLARSLAQERWDGAVDFLHPLLEEDVAPFATANRLTEATPYLRSFAEIGRGEKFVDSRVLAYDVGSAARLIAGEDGRVSALPPASVIVSADVARDLGARVGEELLVRYQGTVHRFRLVAVTADAYLRQVIMSLPDAQRVSGLHERVTGLYFRDAKNAAFIGPSALVASVTSHLHLEKMLRGMKQDVLAIVYIAMGFGFLMMVIFIVTFLTLTIEERKLEYATLLSLGHARGSIATVILAEVAGLVLPAIVGALPAAVALAMVLNERLSRSFVKIHFAATATDFLIPITLSLACVVVAVLVGTRMILRIHLASVLRARHIG